MIIYIFFFLDFTQHGNFFGIAVVKEKPSSVISVKHPLRLVLYRKPHFTLFQPLHEAFISVCVHSCVIVVSSYQ